MGEDLEKSRARKRRWIEAHPDAAREVARRGSSEYRRRNPERVKAALAAWHEANPGKKREYFRRAVERAYALDPKLAWLKYAVKKARFRAQQSGLAFDLADLECPDTCPALGIPLVYARRGARTGSDDSPSIDRINPRLGYTMENCRVISHRANRIKNDASVDELERIASYIRLAQR